MLIIILVSLVVLFIGYIINSEITLLEFIILCSISILVTTLTYVLLGLFTLGPNDIYYASSRINKISYHPYFKERYEQLHVETYPCGTTSKGSIQYCTRTYYTTEYDNHKEYWLAEDSLGQCSYLSKSEYNLIAQEFGNKLNIHTGRYRFHHSDGINVKGDSNLYYYLNNTNSYKYPTNALKKWHNPLKRSSSIFNNEKPLLEYPKRSSWRKSIRNVTWEGITQYDWDVLNTKIYEQVKANVILIRVDDISKAKDIKAAWNNGKKNDIIICYTNSISQPKEVCVFGWYESEVLSSMLESFILKYGITQASLKGIEHIIISYYASFDFKQFKYLSQPPPMWQIILTIILTIIIMYNFYNIASTNEYSR